MSASQALTPTLAPRALVLAAVLIAGCGDVGHATPEATSLAAVPRATPTPSPSRAPRPTPTPRVTPAPVVRSTAADVGCQQVRKPDPRQPSTEEQFVLASPKPKIAQPNAASAAAVRAAAAKLHGLRSYQFEVEFYGRDVKALNPTTFDIGIRATVSHVNGFAMDGVFGFRMREFANSASTGSSSRIVVGANNVWATGQVSGDLEPSSASFGLAEGWRTLSAEGVADRLLAPFGAGFRRVVDEIHGGVRSRHYVATAAGAAAYASALHYDAKHVTAEIWIAAGDGRLVAARVRGIPPQHPAGNNAIDEFQIDLAVTQPNAAVNKVELPVPPVRDPVRLANPPVDVRLEYVVEPPNGLYPTDEELNAMSVTLRRRMGVSTRQVAVDVVSPETLVVTVCATTTADADRIASGGKGALAIMPLPASEYGTTARAGATPIPVPGTTIDSTLMYLTEPSRASQAEYHVDPRTGERGVAFVLLGDNDSIWRDYAATHTGEYAAIVLDGTVLATVPIDDRVAKGRFVFTGEYTEAEARLLAQRLGLDPLPYPLRLVSDTEATSGP